ncbi:hypothetical protein GDN83_18300 [Gordonia jinghuaiqii]|nr:hypothetical protein [Gordonia jinghuaiqii]
MNGINVYQAGISLPAAEPNQAAAHVVQARRTRSWMPVGCARATDAAPVALPSEAVHLAAAAAHVARIAPPAAATAAARAPQGFPVSTRSPRS